MTIQKIFLEKAQLADAARHSRSSYLEVRFNYVSPDACMRLKLWRPAV